MLVLIRYFFRPKKWHTYFILGKLKKIPHTHKTTTEKLNTVETVKEIYIIPKEVNSLFFRCSIYQCFCVPVKKPMQWHGSTRLILTFSLAVSILTHKYTKLSHSKSTLSTNFEHTKLHVYPHLTCTHTHKHELKCVLHGNSRTESVEWQKH